VADSAPPGGDVARCKPSRVCHRFECAPLDLVVSVRFHPYLTGRLVWSGWINHSIGGDANGAPT